MAKKKIEPITGLGNEDKLLVQKSRPLFELWRSELTLAEFKILDTYLARIDSHHPEKRQVIFGKGELEEKLGVKKINQKELKERLKHLMSNVVEIPDTDEKKGFRLITLFEEAVAEQDDYGLWQVKLECTQKAMKYIFNIDKIGYYRYKLRCVTSITSRYTYIMFIYLEDNRYKKSWEVSLDELKRILRCDNEDTYKEFKHFNNLILKKVQKEMFEKTECRYSYEPVKKGRTVVAIKFTLETLADKIEYEQQTFPEPKTGTEQLTFEEQEINYGGKLADLLGSAACDDEFTSEQIRIIQDLVLQAVGHDHMKCCDYLIHKMHLLDYYKAKDRYKYLIRMIKNDIKDPDSAL